MSVTTTNATIDSIETLAPDVLRVFLRMEGEGIAHAPGQYLEISVEVDGEPKWVPFSIANAYRGDGLLELHILRVEESRSNTALRKVLEVGRTLDIRLPKGDTVFRLGDSAPLLLVGAGTGFAQMKAITEAVLAHDPDHHIDLWWAARSARELYMDHLPREWAQRYPNLHYHPVIEEHQPGGNEQDDLEFLVERIDQALTNTLTATQHYSVYISGSPGMVYAVVDALEAIEPLTERVFSDVFSYAPRPSAQGAAR